MASRCLSMGWLSEREVAGRLTLSCWSSSSEATELSSDCECSSSSLFLADGETLDLDGDCLTGAESFLLDLDLDLGLDVDLDFSKVSVSDLDEDCLTGVESLLDLDLELDVDLDVSGVSADSFVAAAVEMEGLVEGGSSSARSSSWSFDFLEELVRGGGSSGAVGAERGRFFFTAGTEEALVELLVEPFAERLVEASEELLDDLEAVLEELAEGRKNEVI